MSSNLFSENVLNGFRINRKRNFISPVANIISSTRLINILTHNKFCKCIRNMTTSSKTNFETIRSSLLKFPGGCVSLIKNESTGIATITLDHPEKRNAMSGAMIVELRDCVEALEKWKEGKGVVLCGKGKNFCSGADLEFVKATGTPSWSNNMCTWMQDTLVRLQRLPLISTCLIQGPSLGGGAEIAIFCDFILAAEDVKYGFVQGKMGITTAWGGGTRLTQKIGATRALDLLLTAKILSAQECVDAGIAEAVVPSEGALEKTLEWLTPRLQYHHTVTRAIKEIITNCQNNSYEEAMKLERKIFVPFWGSELNKEALNKNMKHVKK